MLMLLPNTQRITWSNIRLFYIQKRCTVEKLKYMCYLSENGIQKLAGSEILHFHTIAILHILFPLTLIIIYAV